MYMYYQGMIILEEESSVKAPGNIYRSHFRKITSTEEAIHAAEWLTQQV